MINYIWAFLMIFSVIVGMFTGRLEEVSTAVFESAKSAVDTILTLAGTMCLWVGLMKVAEKSGMVAVFAKFISPFTKRLFKSVKDDKEAMGAISMNIIANIFGLGNAATPLGIRAMERMHKLNKRSETASDDMCMFVVLNTASLQLIPTTMLALRTSYGSQNPGEIILPIWIVTVMALVMGILASKMFEKRSRGL